MRMTEHQRNNDYKSRIIIGLSLMLFTILARQSKDIYMIYMYSSLFVSLKELSKINNNNVSHWIYINFTFFFLVLTNLNKHKEIVDIIIYNSISDAAQYFAGKYFGSFKLFSFTSKTLEGYMFGFLAPSVIFYNHPYEYIILNFLGMVGGCMSSILKRRIGIKHWGKILGSHGGVNDRLDSIMIAVIYYMSFFQK